MAFPYMSAAAFGLSAFGAFQGYKAGRQSKYNADLRAKFAELQGESLALRSLEEAASVSAERWVRQFARGGGGSTSGARSASLIYQRGERNAYLQRLSGVVQASGYRAEGRAMERAGRAQALSVLGQGISSFASGSGGAWVKGLHKSWIASGLRQHGLLANSVPGNSGWRPRK